MGNEIEIYKQRFENYRLYYRLRWQIPQFLLGIGTVAALAVRATSGVIEWWVFCASGATLLLLSIVLFGLNFALRRNDIVLMAVAKSIGDEGMQAPPIIWKSIAHWVAILLFIVGLGLTVRGVFLICSVGENNQAEMGLTK